MADESRVEDILEATINSEPYNDVPQSRIEELLIELKAVIETGGGGGGTKNYNDLVNKPKLNNVELVGNKTADDVNLISEDSSLTPEQIEALISLI